MTSERTGRPVPNVPSLFDLTFHDLEETLASAGVHISHARPLWRALYRGLVTSLNFADAPDFLPPLRRWLSENLRPVTGDQPGAYTLDVPGEADHIPSTDGLTRKFLLRLVDGQTIETVLMAYAGRFTACLSTQAGCAMGCVFCATGQMGFARHLRPGEIVAQVLHAQRALRAGGQPGLRNLVLMGMGEPLAQLRNRDHRGLVHPHWSTAASTVRTRAVAAASITLSTVGLVPAHSDRLTDDRPQRIRWPSPLHAPRRGRAAQTPWFR